MKRALLIGVLTASTMCACIDSTCSASAYLGSTEGVCEPNAKLINGLNHARIDVRTLTVAGLSSSDITAAIAAVSGKLDQIGENLDTATQAVQSAKESLVAARAQARTSNTSTTLSAVSTAQASLDSALENERSLLGQLRESVKGAVSESAATKLTSIWSNLSRGVDVAYLVSNRSESDWNHLRDCLNQRKAAQRLGQTVPIAVASYLAEVEADSAVVAAVSALQNNLAANTAAWTSAVNPG